MGYGHPIIMPSLRSVFSVNLTNLEAGLCSLTYTLWSFVDVPLLLAGDRWNFHCCPTAILGCPIDVWMDGGRDGWSRYKMNSFCSGSRPLFFSICLRELGSPAVCTRLTSQKSFPSRHSGFRGLMWVCPRQGIPSTCFPEIAFVRFIWTLPRSVHFGGGTWWDMVRHGRVPSFWARPLPTAEHPPSLRNTNFGSASLFSQPRLMGASSQS